MKLFSAIFSTVLHCFSTKGCKILECVGLVWFVVVFSKSHLIVVASFGFSHSHFPLSLFLCFACAFKEYLGRLYMHTTVKWLLILPAWLVRHFSLLEIMVTAFLFPFWGMMKYRNFSGSVSLWLLLARGLFYCLNHRSVWEGPFRLPAE